MKFLVVSRSRWPGGKNWSKGAFALSVEVYNLMGSIGTIRNEICFAERKIGICIGWTKIKLLFRFPNSRENKKYSQQNIQLNYISIPASI